MTTNYIPQTVVNSIKSSIRIHSNLVRKFVRDYIVDGGLVNDSKFRHEASNYEVILNSEEYKSLVETYGPTIYTLLKSEVSRMLNNEVLRLAKSTYKSDTSLMQTEIDNLQHLVNKTQDDLTEVERRVDILEHQNTRVERKLGLAESEIKSLDSRVEVLESENRNLSTELSSTQSTLAQAMSAIGDLQDVAEKLGEICKQQSAQLDIQSAQLDIQSAQLDIQSARLTELESRLDSFFNFSMDDLAKAWDDAKHARDLKNRMVYSVTTSLGEITTQMSDNLTDAEVQSVLLESVIKTQGFTENQLLEVVMILDEVHHQYTDEDFVHVDHLIASCERIRNRLVNIKQTALVH